MYIKAIRMNPFEVNSYLAWNKDGRAVAVDCGGEPRLMLAEIEGRGLALTAILLTHLHADHILGVARLSRRSGAPVFASAADAILAGRPPLLGGDEDMLTVPPFAFEDLQPGRRTFAGESCLILPVPGHTPGHLAFFFPKSMAVFTGDTLFCGSVGRTDTPEGDAAMQLASIRERLLVLPEEVAVLPGHGPATTIGLEKAANPFFATAAYTP